MPPGARRRNPARAPRLVGARLSGIRSMSFEVTARDEVAVSELGPNAAREHGFHG